jgi:DNA-3-methyladenine glycosylase II
MSLTYDPDEALAVLLRADRSLAKLVRKAGPFTLRPAKMASPFASLLRAIVSQQLSGKAATTIFNRVAALLPNPTHPSPEAVAGVDDASLRAAGLSQNKLLSIRDLAAKTLDGTVPSLQKLRKLPDDEIIERLTQVRGIGVWTVEMLLMFRLGRPDVFPVDDLGVRRGVMLTYGHAEMPKPKSPELAAIGERWRPYRSVASWYMWRACEVLVDKPAVEKAPSPNIVVRKKSLKASAGGRRRSNR